ncbi:MAG: DUF115 domain-containing protein [Bacteroidetes bacterium]|nr:DUF115 domain-containing protein [Bacteroidota bacterium]
MARPQGALFGLNLLEKNGFGKKWEEARDYLTWRRKYAKRLLQFKDKHKGEDCFIIGNGPSLKNMDLAPLRNYHTFGQNKIFLIFEKVDLHLSYLVSVNQLVIEQSAREFEAMKCPVFLSYTAAKGVVAEAPHIHRLHTLNLWSFYEDIAQPICEGNTVTFVSLQIAFYMGFRRVFLIGVDHSFKQAGQSHEVQTYKGDDENHFHPDYFKGQQWQLADVYGSEVSYHLANYFYQKDGRQILDATAGGKLEVFPKVSFDEALRIAIPK